jgi:hypothetical protein
MHRVAGQDVRAAGTVLVEEPPAIRVASLQLGRVLRVVGHDRRAAILLPPAEGRHVAVVAVQQAGLAGAGLGRPVGLPAGQVVRALTDPARQRRGVAVAQSPAQHVVGQAVDLEEDDARHIRFDPVAPPRLAAHDVAIPGLVLLDREQRRDQRGQHCQPDHDDDTRPPVIHVRAWHRVDHQRHQQPVQRQSAETERQDAEREREPGQQRPYEGVQQPDPSGCEKRRPGSVEREPREQLRQYEQGQGVEHQDDSGPQDRSRANLHGASMTEIA